MQRKVSVAGRQLHGNTLINQALLLVPVFNNIRYGADFEVVFFGKFLRSGVCHISVFRHNFTDNG